MAQISQPLKTKPLFSPGLWLPTVFVLATGGLLALIIFATLAYQVLYLDRIYPGVWVSGTDVGGMTQAEVVGVIGQRTVEVLKHPITIQYDNQSWTFTGEELGMRVDIVGTVNAAYSVGRKGDLLTDMLTHLRLLNSVRNIEPVILYDTGPTNQVLQGLADKIYRAPRDAALIIQPDGKIEVIKAEYGRRLHVEATQPLIEAALLQEAKGPVIPVVQQIKPGITDVETVHQQAENLLGRPLIFRYQSAAGPTEWRLEPKILAGLVTMVSHVNGQGQTEFELELSQDKFMPYFEQMTQVINQEPVDAKLTINPETNELTVLQPSQEGRKLDVEESFKRLLTLKQRSTHLIDLAVTVTPPTIPSNDLPSLGIQQLVSESTSYFKGSSESRMNNIAQAASKFNGVVIPPDGVFSFNKYLGPVTKEAGFDESLIIQGNRTSVGLGGGVCQVSTTAFRAAFYGGYEIIERWAHGYRVGWYETNSVVGLDATVYSPDIDFKFRNDTAHYLLIQTDSDLEEGTVTFRFYGTPTNREVTVTEPVKTNLVKHALPLYEKDPSLPKGVTKQVDWAVDGLDVSISRTVKEGDKVIHEDEIFSHYEPWRAVFKVGG